MTDASGIYGKVDAFVLSARAKAADGLTWAEFGELLVALLRLSVCTLDDVAAMSGEEKKALALAGAATLFDAVADFAVPLWAKPFWAIGRTAVRAIVLALASGAIEQLIPLVRALAK